MRNLKKVLALVLALMMTLSLMVTASASDYKDDSSIEKDVAVDVMSALEVFNGTDGGNFDPTGTLTRAQAAKIIAYLQLGKEAADAYLPELANSQVFDDVKPGRWYSGAVNYCYGLGIVSGRSEKVFDPTGDVTGIEFAKMLLGALGYDSDIEGYTGTSLWSLNIKRQGDAIKMNTNVSYTSAKLTREEACQMAFNILGAAMVKYDKDGNREDIKDNNVTRTLGGSVFGLQQTTGTVTAVGTTSSVKPADTSAVEFAGNLGIEYLGHNVTVYYRVDEEGANVADTVEDKSTAIVMTADATANKKAIAEALGVESWAGTEKTEGLLECNATAGTSTVDQTAGGKVPTITAGTTVIVTNKAITATVTAITYKLDKVTEIKDETYKSLDKTTAVAKGAWVGYDGIAKDDVVVTYTVAGTLYVSPAETVVGKATAIGTDNITVNGTKYTVDSSNVISEAVSPIVAVSSATFTDEYTLYLNPNGTVFAIVGESSATPDSVLAYIVTHYDIDGEKDAYGEGGKTYFLQCVTADGEIVDYQTFAEVDDKDEKLVEVTADAEHEGCYTVTEVIASVSADGDVGFVEIQNNEYSGGAGKDKTLDGTKASIKVTDEDGDVATDTKATNYYDDAVKFIYVTGKTSTLKVETMDGRQTVTIKGETETTATTASTKVLYTIEKSGSNNLVKTVFVFAAYEAPEEYTDDVIFANEQSVSTTKAPYVNADGDTKSDGYVHTVYINGEKKDIIVAANTALSGFYKYSMDGKAYKPVANTASHLKAAAAITGAFNGLITTGAVTDLSVKGATVVNLTDDDTVPTDPTKLTDAHTVALVLNEDGDAAVIVYVTAVAPAEEEEEEVPTSSAHNITEGTHVDQDNVITTVEFKVNGSKVTEAEKDDTVTIEVAATSGKTLTAKVNGGSPINLTEDNGTYTGTFTMPDADAEVVITVA